MAVIPNRNCINCLKELPKDDEIIISKNYNDSGYTFCSIKCIREFLNIYPDFEFKRVE
jgi:hypothetical protein